MWVKFANLDDCYVIDNYEQFYVRIYKGKMVVSVRNATITVEKSVVLDQWYCVGFTADDTEVSIFLNGNFVNKIKSRRVQPKTTAFYIGMQHTGRYKFDGEIGKLRMYNYKLSAGMIAYVAQNENPTVADIMLDEYDSGLMCTYYDITNYMQKYPKNHYEYTILEKEYATSENILSSGNIYEIDSTKTTPPKDDYYLTIIEGVINILVDGHYTFAIDGGDAIELLIDDSEVIGWYDAHDEDNTNDHQREVYLNAGTHKIKFRHQDITGASSFIVRWMKPDSTEFEAIPNDSLFVKKESNHWNGITSIIDTEIDSSNSFETSHFSVLGNTPNRYMSFNGRNDYASISNLPQNIYSNKFRVSYWLYNKGYYAVIVCTGGGEDWQHHFSMYLSSNKLHVTLYDEEKSMASDMTIGWHKIDVVCDGVNCYTYIDGNEDSNMRLEYRKNDWYEVSSPRLVFNRIGDLSRPRWMAGKYYLGDFVYTNEILTKREIQHMYFIEKGRYE
jgi:hypothetical protein